MKKNATLIIESICLSRVILKELFDNFFFFKDQTY